MTNALTTDWYQALVIDCKSIVTERLYRSRQEVIEGWHEVGERIATDVNYRKHAHGNTEIKRQLAIDIGASVQTLYKAVQFYEKFPELSAALQSFEEGKNISWRKITRLYLPTPSGNDDPEPELCKCPHCGNEHKKWMP